MKNLFAALVISCLCAFGVHPAFAQNAEFNARDFFLTSAPVPTPSVGQDGCAKDQICLLVFDKKVPIEVSQPTAPTLAFDTLDQFKSDFLVKPEAAVPTGTLNLYHVMEGQTMVADAVKALPKNYFVTLAQLYSALQNAPRILPDLVSADSSNNGELIAFVSDSNNVPHMLYAGFETAQGKWYIAEEANAIPNHVIQRVKRDYSGIDTYVLAP